MVVYSRKYLMLKSCMLLTQEYIHQGNTVFSLKVNSSFLFKKKLINVIYRTRAVRPVFVQKMVYINF